MKTVSKILFVFLACLLLWRIERFCHKKTDGFQIAKILSHVPVSSLWEVPPFTPQEKEELEAIFSQPFFFLDSGGQCYAFLSADGKLVLKLFKMHHLRQYSWLGRVALPGPLNLWRNQFLLFQKHKLERIFSSSKIAYTELKEETGLLYLNLNPTLSSLHVTLFDKIGIQHRVSLKNVPFALQYKADNPFDTLRWHLSCQDMEGAKQVVREIFDYLTVRYQKGIRDTDPALRRNIGLLKTRAISIDIGSFVRAAEPLSSEESKQALLHDTRRMHRWLQKRSPELANYLDSLIAAPPG